MKRTYMFAVVAFAVLALGGCKRSPAHVSQQTLESDPTALEAAMKACSPDSQNGTAPSSSDCRHVAFAAYVVRSQLAGGLVGFDTAKIAMMEHYFKTGKLPASNNAAGLPVPTALVGKEGTGKDVESVTVGPMPGMVTVKWSGGALAGKVLVLTPRLPGGSHTQLCWNVDAAATTVPEMVRKLSPMIVGGCN